MTMSPLSTPVRLALGTLLTLAGTALALAQMPGAAARPFPIELTVDASDVARRILHARMTIPAAPGPLTLQYPKWLPGEHGPTGPVTDVAGLKIHAGGQLLPWRRDPTEMYAF